MCCGCLLVVGLHCLLLVGWCQFLAVVLLRQHYTDQRRQHSNKYTKREMLVVAVMEVVVAEVDVMVD